MFPKTLNTSNPEAVYRFIGGRKRYNAWRQFMAMWRRKQVAELLVKGIRQSDIARELRVHPSTICRDVRWLREESNKNPKCPCCGR